MTTVYVAAEKLMIWNKEGHLSLDESLIDTLRIHSKSNRFVIYFAPARFGLWFDGQNEVEDAWRYIAHGLKPTGFHPADVFLFNEDAETEIFQKDLAAQPENQATALILSDAPCDETLAQTLGIQKVTEIPSHISSLWKKIDIRRAFKTFVAAAIQA